MENNRSRNGSSSSATNGASAGGAGCPVDFEVLPQGNAVPMMRNLPPGMVINRDHVIGFVAGVGFLGLAYWLFCKCKD